MLGDMHYILWTASPTMCWNKVLHVNVIYFFLLRARTRLIKIIGAGDLICTLLVKNDHFQIEIICDPFNFCLFNFFPYSDIN